MSCGAVPSKRRKKMTKSEMFKMAHKIAKDTVEAVGNYVIAFSLALKSIYRGVIEMVKTTEQKLIELGASVWEKNSMRRIYINANLFSDVFALRITTYGTGNIRSAVLDGDKISNSKAYKLVSEKTYFDCVTQKFVGPLAGYEKI